MLDTHAWGWWVTRPEKLSRRQRTAIERSLRESRAPARLDQLRDPADQLIVATALERGARLVTSDARSADAELVPVIA